MRVHRIAPALVSLGWLLAGSAGPIGAQDKDTVIEGQVKVGVHKLKIDAGTLYQFEVKGKNFSPNVIIPNTFLLNRADFKERNVFRTLYMPAKSGEQTVMIIPNLFGQAIPEGTLDYTLTLKAMKLSETPVLKKEEKITSDDPRLNQAFRKTHYKAYTIKMTKGTTYVIDMKRVGADNKLDPYLLLENPKMQVIAQDDDGGGFPHARIMITPMDDGEYRILATGLSDFSGVGDFALTVRTVKEDK